MSTKLVLDCETGESSAVELSAEELQQREKDEAATLAAAVGYAFGSAEDEERLRLVNERARTDPAFAALSDFVLRGVQR